MDSVSQPPNEQPTNLLERQLYKAAQDFGYPATPDIAAGVRYRGRSPRLGHYVPRGAWAALAVLLILASALFVPRVWAAVVEFLQLGAVRIFLVEPTPTPIPEASPEITPTPLASLLDLAGETTLEKAQAQVNFPIRLPAEIGLPDKIFLQDFNGPMVILVWVEAEISLHYLGPGVLANKGQPRIIRNTTVHEQPALWTEGPYPLQLSNGDIEFRRIIEGNVLIWTEGVITYRLESSQSLTVTQQLAESLE